MFRPFTNVSAPPSSFDAFQRQTPSLSTRRPDQLLQQLPSSVSRCSERLLPLQLDIKKPQVALIRNRILIWLGVRKSEPVWTRKPRTIAFCDTSRYVYLPYDCAPLSKLRAEPRKRKHWRNPHLEERLQAVIDSQRGMDIYTLWKVKSLWDRPFPVLNIFQR